MLKQVDEEYAAFQKTGLDFLCLAPYDNGGCGCEKCRPWGTNGFLKLGEEIAGVFHRRYPRGKITLSAWCFDESEWAGLTKTFEKRPDWVDYIMTAKVRNGQMPGGLPRVTFLDISMFDTGGCGPWGGFGANPIPAQFQEVWDRTCQQLAGGFCYSEGIYEDMNKVIHLALSWNGRSKAMDAIRAYAAYEYSPEVAEDVAGAVQILEANGPRALVDQAAVAQSGGKYEFRKDAEGCERGVVRLLRPDAGAARCYELLNAADKKLSADGKKSWRWRILLLKSLIDKELVASQGLLTAACEEATKELESIYHAQGAYPAVKPPYVEWMRKANAAGKGLEGLGVK